MNKITRVRAKDAFAYTLLDFHFTDGIHAVEGENGASKTSLFMVVLQALFNKNPKGTKIEAVSNRITGEPYEIEVWFTANGKEYWVLNSRKTGKIEITEDGNEIHLKRIPDNLAKIADILGADYAMAADLMYQNQKSAINLVESGSDGERKKFVNRINKFDELDEMLARVKERDKELSGKAGKITLLQNQAEALESSIVPLKPELEDLSGKEEELKSSLQRRRIKAEGLQVALAKAKAEMESLKEKVVETSKLRKVLSDLLDARKELEEIAVPELAEAELQDKRGKLLVQLSEADNRLNELIRQEAVAQKRHAVVESIEEAKSRLDAIVLPEHEKEFCESNLQKLMALQAAATTTVTTKKLEIARVNKGLGDGTCPMCKQALPDKDKLSQELANLETELATWETKLTQAEKAIPKYKAMLVTWEKLAAETYKLNRLEADLAAMEEVPLVTDLIITKHALLAESSKVKKELSSVESDTLTWGRITKAKDAVAKLEAQAGNTEVGSVSDLVDKVEKAESKVDTLQFDLSAVNKDISLLDAELTKCREHNAMAAAVANLNMEIEQNNKSLYLQVEDVRKELFTCERELEYIKAWVQILGNKGFRVHKINKFLKNLNLLLIKYLDLLCDGRITCTFFIDEDGEIQFTVTDPDKSLPYECWSNGEQTRVKLACLFSVLDLLEVMGSVSFNLLVLDEIFGALDEGGRSGLFKVLDHLKGKGRAVYTIAHSALALPLTYDSVIKAVKHSNGTSSIQGG